MITSKLLKPIALSLAIILLVVSLGGCFPNKVAYKAGGKGKEKLADLRLKSLAKKRRKPTKIEKLSLATEELKENLDELTKKKEITKADIDLIKDSYKKIVILDKKVKKELARTTRKLKRLKVRVALIRQKRFIKDYKEKLAKLKKDLKALIKEKDSPGKFLSQAKSLSTYLASLSPKETPKVLGKSLPHQNLNYKAGEPSLGVSIAPAYMSASSALPSSLPKTPTEADLAPTIDTSQTTAIKDLANKLGKDPIKIYQFVRNTIIYTPYYGSRKGAQETLWEKQGNDIDQANLLISLYRYLDIPTRYVTGVVEIPIDRAMNWVGVNDPEVAAKLFSAAGIPSKAIVEGGHITKLQLEHTWVEAYLGYERYRGIAEGNEGQKWIPLDPSFKQYKYKEPANLLASANFNPQGLVDLLASTGTVTKDIVTGVDLNSIKSQFDREATELVDYFNTNYPSSKAEDLFGSRRIIEEKVDLLPASLPRAIKVNSITAEYADLPASKREEASISIPGFVTKSRPVASLLGKRITVSYVGATQSDRDIIASYGDISKVPAYLIRMVPVIGIDGQTTTATTSAPMGEDQILKVTIDTPRGSQTLSHHLTVGGFYSLVLDGGHIPAAALERNSDLLKTQIDELIAYQQNPSYNPNIDVNTLLGEMLTLTGLIYFAQLNSTSDAMVLTSKVTDNKFTSELLTGVSLAKSYVFDLPIFIQPAGTFIDVGLELHSYKARDGDTSKEKLFALQYGTTSSYLEHLVLEQMFGIEAISTMKVLQIANNSNIPIYTLNSDNLSRLLPQLTIEEEIKTKIKEAVLAGNLVVVPKDDISYYGWNGVGYIVLNPNTYEGAYLISGASWRINYQQRFRY
jgi:hypothetical protein